MAIAKPDIGKESLAGIKDKAEAFIGSLNNTSASPRRLVAAVEIALVILLAVLLARTALALLAPLGMPSGDIVATAPAKLPEAISSPAQNPFPETPAVVVDAPATDVVTETDLNLTLMGTWAEGDGAGSAAIKTPNGKQDRFDVGDDIINGVMLDAVYGDHVVIERGGAKESLRFETKSTSERTPPRRQTRSSSQRNNQSSGNNLANIIRPAPGRTADGGTAIEFYAGRNRAAFGRLGFENGDVLHSIDGEPAPDNAAQLAGIFAQLQRARSVTIEVNRDGQIIPITINSENLSGE